MSFSRIKSFSQSPAATALLAGLGLYAVTVSSAHLVKYELEVWSARHDAPIRLQSDASTETHADPLPPITRPSPAPSPTGGRSARPEVGDPYRLAPAPRPSPSVDAGSRTPVVPLLPVIPAQPVIGKEMPRPWIERPYLLRPYGGSPVPRHPRGPGSRGLGIEDPGVQFPHYGFGRTDLLGRGGGNDFPRYRFGPSFGDGFHVMRPPMMGGLGIFRPRFFGGGGFGHGFF